MTGWLTIPTPIFHFPRETAFALEGLELFPPRNIRRRVFEFDLCSDELHQKGEAKELSPRRRSGVLCATSPPSPNAKMMIGKKTPSNS
jgi:hypothetical protein